MLKRVTVLFTLILFTLCLAYSSDAVCEEKKDHEVRGHLLIGGATLDLDGLNSRFENKGYSEFSENVFTMGGGAFFNEANSRFLLGVEGRFLIGDETSSVVRGTEYSSSILGGYGLLNAGYLAVESDRLDVFPILGIGVGGIRAKIARSSFDDILDDPHGPASLSTVSFLVNIGLEADFKIPIAEQEANGGYFLIGVRGGYLFSPFDSGWYIEDMRLSGGPDGGVNGPYICLTIGGGGKYLKKGQKK